MTTPTSKKTTVVHKYRRHVPVSKKNPSGITNVRQHVRRIPGTALTANEIKKTRNSYTMKGLIYPKQDDLEYRNGNKYDDLIAIWTDYFNSKFLTPPSAPLDPNIVKALIASESDFQLDPKNPTAIGIAQITRATLKILQDSNGEAKKFFFTGIRQQDLKDPEIAIPLAIRWLFRKRETATNTLGRIPTPEELILEYKGLLKSKSEYKRKALIKFKTKYAKLNQK